MRVCSKGQPSTGVGHPKPLPGGLAGVALQAYTQNVVGNVCGTLSLLWDNICDNL
jgi:hypothetical protein